MQLPIILVLSLNLLFVAPSLAYDTVNSNQQLKSSGNPIKKIKQTTVSAVKGTANKTKSAAKSAVEGIKNNVEIELGNERIDEDGNVYYENHEDDLDD